MGFARRVCNTNAKLAIKRRYLCKIKFTEGNPCKLRVPLKAYQIDEQKENFEYFCNEIKNKVIQ